MASATLTTLDSLVHASLPDGNIVTVTRPPGILDLIAYKRRILTRGTLVYKQAAIAPSAGTLTEGDDVAEQVASDGTPIDMKPGQVAGNWPVTDLAADFANGIAYVEQQLMPAFMLRADADLLALIAAATPDVNTTKMTVDIFRQGFFAYEAKNPGAAIKFAVFNLNAFQHLIADLDDSAAAVRSATAGDLIANLGAQTEALGGQYMGVNLIRHTGVPQVDADHWMTAFLGGSQLTNTPDALGYSGLIGSPLSIVWHPGPSGEFLRYEQERDAAGRRTLLVGEARYVVGTTDAARLGALQTNKV